MRRVMILASALALVGCYETTAPCATDAGTGDAAAPVQPGTLAATTACGLVWEVTSGLDPETGCGYPACPWRLNPSGARCNPEAIDACYVAVSTANDCAHLREALAGCDPDACR